jgi:hypothetical protein
MTNSFTLKFTFSDQYNNTVTKTKDFCLDYSDAQISNVMTTTFSKIDMQVMSRPSTIYNSHMNGHMTTSGMGPVFHPFDALNEAKTNKVYAKYGAAAA